MNIPPATELLLWSALPVFFVGFWLFTVTILSRLGGWNALAKDYRATIRPDGAHYSWRSLHIAPLFGYNNCISVTLSRDGIHLVPSFFFRFAHPALLIPWSRIGSIQEKNLLFRRLFYLPIDAAGKRLELYLPETAQIWIERNIVR